MKEKVMNNNEFKFNTIEEAIEDIKAGKIQVMGFLLGQIKKELGNIDVPLTQKLINVIIASC